jgi:hypothetical protein
MNWQIKALVQKTLGVLPGGSRAHLLLQRKFGGLRDFERECDGKIQDWEIMAGHLRKTGLDFSGATFLEIGTGWYPTLPFCTYLAGGRRVITMDLIRHLQPDLALRCARRIGNHLENIARISGRALDEMARALSRLTRYLAGPAPSLGDVHYLAPADARYTRMEPGTVDVVFSNSVLEHVPEADIASMMRESYRLLRRGGLMFHSVNCGDHYSYVDPSITQLNYLRYSEAEWKKWNNRFLYQNRLRAGDLVNLAVTAGFEIILNTAHPTEERRAQLESLPVAACFHRYAPDDLCITTVDFLGRKP